MAALLLFVLVLPISARSLDEEVTIDPTQGEVDGQAAIGFWPAGGPPDYRLLPPDGFSVHLVPERQLSQELMFLAGEWFCPPPGRYKVWMEGTDLISPFPSVLTFSNRPFQGLGKASVMPVLPAGRVGLDPSIEWNEGGSLRLLHLESHVQSGRLHREMTRRLHADSSSEDVLMPEGPVVGILFDEKLGQDKAISSPVPVISSRRVSVVPTAPAPGTSGLLVALERPSPLSDLLEDDVVVFAVGPGGEKRPADVRVGAAQRVIAIWYGLPWKHTHLEVESGRVWVRSGDIALRPGRVERSQVALRPLPSLTVELRLPEELRGEPLQLAVTSRREEKVLQAFEVAGTSEEHRFGGLPLSEYEVSVEAGQWKFRVAADLSAGLDQTVAIEPEPIEITGTVFLDSDPHAATVAFLLDAKDQKEVRVETNAEGEYEIALYVGGVSPVVFADLQGMDIPRYARVLDHPITESQVLDIHVPASTRRVRVIDAVTQESLEGAQVFSMNRFEKGADARTVVMDENGEGVLQPLREGTLELSARADGYLDRSFPAQEVSAEMNSGSLEIALEPAGEAGELRLLLPGGRPADGAEILAVASLQAETPLWQGSADRKGKLNIPEVYQSATLLIRHPQAGFLVQPWPAGAEGGVIWSLPEGSDLVLQAETLAGEPAKLAWIGLSVNGVRLVGFPLSWLTRSGGTTDQNGRWRGRGVSASNLEVLAWPHTEARRGRDGMLDAQSVAVNFPWPTPLVLMVAE